MQKLVSNSSVTHAAQTPPAELEKAGSDYLCEVGLGLLLFGAIVAMTVPGWSFFSLAAPLGMVFMVVSAIRQ
ncbi:MAG: hypothetical protein PW790_09725 [Parvibaculaceae bacterium]|nr:hypothetical protein [Parvibaculaceae bacterium]